MLEMLHWKAGRGPRGLPLLVCKLAHSAMPILRAQTLLDQQSWSSYVASAAGVGLLHQLPAASSQ